MLWTHSVCPDFVWFTRRRLFLLLNGPEMFISTGSIFEPSPFPFCSLLVALCPTTSFSGPLIARLLGLFRLIDHLVDVVNFRFRSQEGHNLA